MMLKLNGNQTVALIGVLLFLIAVTLILAEILL